MNTVTTTHVLLRTQEVLHVLSNRDLVIAMLNGAWRQHVFGIDFDVAIPFPNESWKKVSFYVTLHMIAGVGEEHQIEWKEFSPGIVSSEGKPLEVNLS